MAPLTETAVNLASNGKIGALNLLFKRHPYSLSPSILEILSAIPETVPVQSYGQLLPGRSPPSVTTRKDGESVECEEVATFVNKLPPGSKGFDVKTENILKHSVGFVWPSVTELSDWYKKRAMDIDKMSGQLDNCLSLVECGFRKGIVELQEFLEDISYLNRLIYSDGCDVDLTMTLATWEQLSDYEKFRIMLKGIKVEAVVERLREIAIPFMQHCLARSKQDSFVVRWMKEESADNKLDICLAVTENACSVSPVDGLFVSDSETIECALNCIYLCTLTDQWNLMASILSKLPRRTARYKSCRDFTPRYSAQGFGTPRFSYLRNQLSVSEAQSDAFSLNEEDSLRQHFQGSDELLDSSVDNLEKRIKVAGSHVEVGRMLQFYQVPKPISFFLDSQSDEKNVRQLLRLILSKFGRRQPGRSDNEWANMWRDMQYLQDKAFHFLDTEYMLTEFCRGLLKAGKFSLARNYLKGTSAIALAAEKAENLVIQAAREYFYSASSLSCTEIWKVKECLSLLPNSKIVQAELDMIDALTVRLPTLGVNLLPVEFRQIRNPMEIINMVISNQRGAYLGVEEIIEIAKLLGLRSEDDITFVEESVAREAAVAGDVQLAFDLCLVLAKKGHGPIWDLCAAIARGPLLDGMDAGSRKQLLGFALSHCDEESIGDLLNAWKKLISELEPWEAWDESSTLDSSLPKAQEDASSSRITSTVVALKSTQLITSISPNFKVSVEDLVSVDSALSCFTPICRAATTKSDLNALQSLLDEWEELFLAAKEEEVAGDSQEDAVNNWSNDEWDEGWESFAEEPVSNVEGKVGAAPVHPLHACWMEVIRRLVEIHEPGLALEVLDRSLSGPNGILLDENEARFMLQLVGEVDCFHVLKILLLLPYEAPRLQCLQLVEAELADDGGFSRHVEDYELLVLVLSSGALRVVAGDPAFGKVLSYVCYMTGHLARVCQVDFLRLRRDGTATLFGALLLPAIVSELVEAGQHFLAAFIVSRWMHTPESLGCLEVMEVILRRYSEGQVFLQAQAQGGDGGGGTVEVAVNSFGSLGNTVLGLKGKLGSMLQSALSAIPTSVGR